VRPLGRVVETDTPRTLRVVKRRPLARALEVDTPRALRRVKSRPLGRAGELDTARPLGRGRRDPLGRASETDTARPMSRRIAGVIPILRVLETDTARPFTWWKLTSRGWVGQPGRAPAAAVVEASRRESTRAAPRGPQSTSAGTRRSGVTTGRRGTR
jgi:hypothetical protein